MDEAETVNWTGQLTIQPHKAQLRRMAYFSASSSSSAFTGRRRMASRFHPTPCEMNVKRGSKPTVEPTKTKEKLKNPQQPNTRAVESQKGLKLVAAPVHLVPVVLLALSGAAAPRRTPGTTHCSISSHPALALLAPAVACRLRVALLAPLVVAAPLAAFAAAGFSPETVRGTLLGCRREGGVSSSSK